MRYLKIAVILCFIPFINIFGQSKGFSTIDPEKLLQEDITNKYSKDLISKSEPQAIGNVVVPEYYFVGPGDAIAIQNLTASISQEVLFVTSESTLLLPRIGEINLKGKTLAEAKKILMDTIKLRNPASLVYISLFQARTVLITIKGDVTKPGTYSMPASYRVSTAIKVSNLLQTQNSYQGQTMPALIQKERKQKLEKVFSGAGLPALSSYASRNISVLHINGEAQNADIEKALALDNPKFDPYIREGDEIFVNFNRDNYPTISISGAVLNPSTIPFKKGDMASFLLKLGGGFADNADKDAIYLLNPSKNEKIRIYSDSALKLNGPDSELEPGSTIVVPELKPENGNTEFGTVAVTGEVANPGSYIIKKDENKIKDVISKAGGFRDGAYLPMCYIMRRSNQNFNTVNPGGEFFDNFQRSDLLLEDTLRYNLDINYRRPYVACDFEALYEHNSDKDNISLKDGDVIVVPADPKTIYVYGQVNNPGYITFEKGKTIEWYIEKAGGYATGADKKRTRVIRFKNKVWFRTTEENRIYSGDEIYIPKSPDYPAGMELQSYYLIATAIGTVIQITYLILTLFKK